MSSVRITTRKDGSTYTQILFREKVPGREKPVQTSESFDNHASALRFKKILDSAGIVAARKILDAEAAPVAAVVTLNDNFADTYISGLTGISKAQKDRYRAYMRNDFGPAFGDLPLAALCTADDEQNSVVQQWVNDEEVDGAAPKTIANKHGFLSQMLKAAAKRKLIPHNPCEDTRLPRRQFEPTFLEPEEFDLLMTFIPERWQPLVFFLVSTGVRFGEATALRVGDIKTIKSTDGSPDETTARIARAWKYTGEYSGEMGGPKTKRGIRTINVAPEAVGRLDLARRADALLFATAGGGRGKPGARISAQNFHTLCWSPAMEKFEAKTRKRPRPHDLRHTCASWMLNNGAELTDVQGHLGHESITTTVDRYGHLDRRSGQRAAAAVSKALGKR